MRTWLLAGFFGWIASAPLLCEAATSVERVFPGVGQRGTEFEIDLFGSGFADAEEVLLYSPGVSFVGLKPGSDTELKVRLKAAEDCPLGSHAFRVRGRSGISELHTFRITPLPVVVAAEPNESAAEAQLVPPNSTVPGVIDAGDADFFKLTLKKGDRLAAEVEAIRVGASMLDANLKVTGPDGTLLADVDDTSLFRQDPFVTLIAPQDGDYVIQLHETSFEGDERYRYALHLGSFPRPALVYPAGGPAGQTLQVRFDGDVAGPFEQALTLPLGGPTNFGAIAVRDGATCPTPNPFRVSPFGNVLEVEPNDDAEQLSEQSTDLPVAFNGILEKTADVDAFRFRAPAGKVYQFESFAFRLGSGADTVLSIVDSRGIVVVSNDDDGSHDSRLIFEPADAGEYLLLVTDKRGGGGHDFIYRVEATEFAPSLTAFLSRPNRLSQDRQTISIPRGNRVIAFLAVQRRIPAGTPEAEQDVRLSASGLPSGTLMSEAAIPSDRFWTPVVLEAGADAPLGGSLAELRASLSGGQPLQGGFQQTVDLVAASADALFQAATVDRLAVAVVDEAAFSISLSDPKAALALDGTLGLEIQVERKSDFDGPVDVTFPFLPPWVDGPAKITIPAGANSGIYTLHAFPTAAVRKWPLVAEADPAGGSARDGAMNPQAELTPRRARRRREVSAVAVASQLNELRIESSPVTGTIGLVVAEQGTTIPVICKLEQHGGLPAQMTVTLEGLPNRVQVSPVQMNGDAAHVEFQVVLDPTCPVGEFPDLVVRLSGDVGGQPVSYCVGRGSVLQIEPKGLLVTDETGRPLSRLEVLKRSTSKITNEPEQPATKK
jgi:hypothetical protein